MATEHGLSNGNFAPTQMQNYDQSAINHSANNSLSASTADYNGASSMNNVGSGGNAEIPKDEVGWYFVEQYYTTLSKNPEKLYLFYNKRSFFVSGSETEKVNVCVGQKAINDRIKELDIQDCKVRVTNVDSQASGQNIVIQVIGEMSNKTTPRTKFTQTFVLAEQTNGYFVLNDIFRYIIEEEDEVEEELAPQAQNEVASGHQESNASAVAEKEPQALSSSNEVAERDHDAHLVDDSLKQAKGEEPAAVAAQDSKVDNATANDNDSMTHDAEVAAEVQDTADAINETPAEEEPQKPESPTPTPAAASPPKQAPVQAPAPAQPALPKTWANLVAGGNKAAAANKAQAATPTTPTPQAQSQPRAAPAPAQVQTSNPASTPQEGDQPPTPQSAGSEWQTAQRHDYGKKQQRPAGPATPVDNTRAYMKNISESVGADELRSALTKYGELTYLDINRQKNCAFADFTNPASYQAAVQANPHEIGGERIFVEQRHIRPPSMGGFPARGGPAARGRGGMEGRPGGQGRGGFQKDFRGGVGGARGRGGATARGRGVSQAA